MTRAWPGWRNWPMARDLHEVRPAAADGHASAQLAIAACGHRLRREIAAMAAA
jgi:acetate kinase